MFDAPQFSQSELKRAFGSFPTGVTVMTTLDREGGPVGMTVSSFNTVSLSPALVLWSIRTDSAKREAFSWNQRFAVNVLSHDQRDICYAFAKPQDEAFRTIGWHGGLGGVPCLDGASARLECRIWARHLAGDHEILIGEIDRLSVSGEVPLVFHAGKLCQLTPHSQEKAA